VTARSDGTIIKGPEKEISPQPKLVVTDRYGNPAPQPLKRPETAKLFTQDKNNIIREHTVKSPSRFSGFKSSLKNFGSRTGVFFQRNIGKHLTGDRAMGLLGKAGNTGINALSGITNLGGRPGGVFSHLGRFNRNGGGRGFFGRLGKGSPGGSGGMTKKGLSSGKKWALAASLMFMLIFGMLVTGNGTGVPSGEAAPLPPGSTTDLNTCKFTRNGVATQIPSSRLNTLFNEVAAKTGVPAAALASLAMHESSVFTSTAKDDHDAFGNTNTTNTTGCTHFGLTGLGLSSSPTGALGLMQIQPSKKVHDIIAASGKIPSFENVGAYSADGVERGAQFIGKTADTLTLQDFCDIKTSVYLAAGVLISKNGGRPPTTGKEINKSVCGYYGACQYGIYNYGDEAETDFKNCKPAGGTSPAPAGPIGFSLTCPVGNSTVTCGTEANPVNNCGHGGISYEKVCNPTYYICQGNRYSEALYYAIDIKGKNSNAVALPFVNGNEPVEWTRIDEQPIPIGGGSWGYRVDYKTTYKGQTLILNFTHLNNQINLTKSLTSGTQIGTYITTSQINHLHTGLSVDGRWIEPIQQAKMCTN
ncbi:MAG: hypothetical protein NUV73_03985, partial [Candidatus Daviesbacteria bacterium]|nr:hypothetical protein [Candidatus Daviesbacteria bacterium]